MVYHINYDNDELFAGIVAAIRAGCYCFDFDVNKNYANPDADAFDKQMALRTMINAAYTCRGELHSRITVYSVTMDELYAAVIGSSLAAKQDALPLYFVAEWRL